MNNKIGKKSFYIYAVLLIAIEQIIKLIINFNFLNHQVEIIPSMVYFKPVFNRDYSWINSMFQMGIGRWVHIIFVIIVLALLFCIYKYCDYVFKSNTLISLTFLFMLSGALCSLIDKLFWNGSLDYILFQGLFTFDLKDIYLNLGLVFLLIFFIKNHKKFNEDSDSKVIKEFFGFVKNGLKPTDNVDI